MRRDLGDGRELDQYDNEFYLAEYRAVKDGTKTQQQIVNDALNRTYQTGAAAGKTVKQFYMEQYEKDRHSR